MLRVKQFLADRKKKHSPPPNLKVEWSVLKNIFNGFTSTISHRSNKRVQLK